MNDMNNTHGGAREGSGRKPLAGEGGELTKARSITLSEADWQFLEQIGGGNISKGVRQIVASARELIEN
jgi:hypothetical protein